MEASKRLAARALRSIVLVLIATWALYLVVVHLVLWTPLLRRATNGDPQSLFVSYGAAWSLWPGRVHANALQIRIRDAGADALVTIDRADLSFDVPALFSRRVLVRDLRAIGVSVAVRPRYREEELKPETLEGQPEIPGLPDPRRASYNPKSQNPFRLQLQKVVADPVREVWVGPYRFSGDAHVEGSFYLHPGRELAIGPAVANVRSGDLVLAKRPFGQIVHGTARCTVPTFDVEHGTDADLLRAFHVELELESDIEDFGFLQRWLAPLGPLRIDGGKGHAKGRMRLDGGVLVSGSDLELHASRLAAHHPLGSLTADVVGGIEVDGHEARRKIELEDLELTHHGDPHLPIEASTVVVAARTQSVDLSRAPLEGLVVSADAPLLRIKDLRLLELLVPEARISGAATAMARVDFDPQAKLLAGEASVTVPHAATTFEGIGIAGKVKASAKLARFHLSTMKGVLESVHLDVDDVKVRAAGGTSPPPPWWGRFEAKEVEFDPAHVIADLTGKMRDARPIVYVFDAKGSLPTWARGLLSLDGLEAGAHFETGPDRIELDDLEAAGGLFEVGGHVREKGGRREGELYVGNGLLGVKIPLDTGAGSAKPAIGGGPKSAQ